MKFEKNQIALGVAAATLSMAGALISPQAVADARVEALEAQVNQMSEMLQQMQGELNRVRDAASRSAVDTAKVQELDEWAASVKASPASAQEKNHIFAVRGGWERFNDNRGSSAGIANSGIGQDILTSPTDQDAFYVGGAIDFTMNNDLFGLMDDTSFGIELGLEYSELGDRKHNGLQNVIVGAPVDLLQNVTVNMLRISASPKIRFMHGSKFRPWLIPAGLDINIISPPSDAVTVLNTGMQFGAGADYELLDGIVLGADARYHESFDNVDGVETDGFTLGGSVGFKF